MIRLANFVLIIEKIINFNKKDIDKGKTPPSIYRICSSIRETFCLSYAIRKDYNLYLYFHEEKVLIEFKGAQLRYLSSDERSQALLLEKAFIKAKQILNLEYANRSKSTPGIFERKFPDNSSFINYLKIIDSFKPIFIIDYCNKNAAVKELFIKTEKFENINNLNDYTYILPIYNIFVKNFEFFKLFKDLEEIIFISLLRIKLLEDKILYVNFQIDRQENSSS